MLASPGAYGLGVLGSFAYWAGDILCLWAALQIVNSQISVAALVLAYSGGYVLTRRSLPAGGAGLLEVALTLALVGNGHALRPGTRRRHHPSPLQLLAPDRARAVPPTGLARSPCSIQGCRARTTPKHLTPGLYGAARPPDHVSSRLTAIAALVGDRDRGREICTGSGQRKRAPPANGTLGSVTPCPASRSRS